VLKPPASAPQFSCSPTARPTSSARWPSTSRRSPAAAPCPEVVEELQHRYAEIGLREDPLPEGPPLTRWTLLQGQMLGELLGQKVYVGMRNWHPYIADVVAQMRADGVSTRASSASPRKTPAPPPASTAAPSWPPSATASP
jgi:hypothetical protein